MSGEVLRLLLQKKSARALKSVRPVRPAGRIRRAEMIERRSLCMAQIACWRAGTGVAEDLTEKARQLLTRHWSTSSWRGRAHILRTAEWLLGISKGAEAALASLHEIGNSSPVPPPRRLRSLKERSHDVDLADSR